MTIVRTSSPILYIDTSGGSQAYCGYAAYLITNDDGVDYANTSATISSFTGGVGSVSRASHESGVINLGSFPNGTTKMAYFYLKATDATAVAEHHVVKVFDDVRGTGTEKAAESFSLTVEDTIQANANKVTSAMHSPNPASVGGILTITVTGATGTIGSAKVLSFSPATYDNWRSDALQLVSSEITFSGSSNSFVTTDKLLVDVADLTSTANTDYVAVYRFKLVAQTTATVPLSPISYISSGTQIKHTAVDGLADLEPVQLIGSSLILEKSVDSTQVSLSAVDRIVTYTLSFTNNATEDINYPGANNLIIEQISDTITPPGAVNPVYQAGTSYLTIETKSGTPVTGPTLIEDPAITANTYKWNTFSIPPQSVLMLSYDVLIPADPGNYINSAYGIFGASQIDSTLDGSDDMPATTTVNVSSNTAPELTGSVVLDETREDGDSLNKDISGAFTDSDGDSLSYTATGLPAGLSLDSVTGIITGDLGKLASASSPYSVTVTASDGLSTVSESFVITVSNPAPVAGDDTASVAQGGSLTGMDVTGNDSDPDNDDDTPLAYTLASNVSNGTLSFNNGSYDYSPDGGFAGTDSFTYTVTDSQGASDTATVTITVSNTAPELTGSGILDETREDGYSINKDISGAFTDSDGDSLSYTATGLPAGLSLDSVTGIITGDLGKLASASSPYSVTVTASDGLSTVSESFVITVSNPAPVAGDDTASVAQGGSLTGMDVTGNDSDPDNDDDTPLAYALASNVSNGTLSFNNGSYDYSPDGGFAGMDSFTYTVTDSQGASDTATATITVSNTSPELTGSGILDETREDGYSINKDISGAFTDSDGDSLSYTATGLPAGLSLDSVTGIITGDLGKLASASSPYSVTVTASDGLSTVSESFVITVSNPAPTDSDYKFSATSEIPFKGTVSTNALDADGDTPLTFKLLTTVENGTLDFMADGTFNYTSNVSYGGSETFTYEVTDSQGAESQSYTVTLNVNIPPEIINSGIEPEVDPESGLRYMNLYVQEGASEVIVVEGYDGNGDLYGLNISGGQNAGNFTLEAATDTLRFKVPTVYDHNAVENNTHRVEVQASDPQGGTDTVLFVVHVVTSGSIQVVPIDELRLDTQTGLFKQRIRVTNLHGHRIAGFRVVVSLPEGGITLFNLSGTLEDGTPYLQYANSLDAKGESGSSIDLIVEYLQPSLEGFETPDYSILAVLTEPLESEVTAAAGLTPPRIILLPVTEDVMIEWETEIQSRYAIEYSHDGSNWKRVSPSINAIVNVTQWIDNGLPKTTSHPRTQGQRFYRIVHLAD